MEKSRIKDGVSYREPRVCMDIDCSFPFGDACKNCVKYYADQELTADDKRLDSEVSMDEDDRPPPEKETRNYIDPSNMILGDMAGQRKEKVENAPKETPVAKVTRQLEDNPLHMAGDNERKTESVPRKTYAPKIYRPLEEKPFLRPGDTAEEDELEWEIGASIEKSKALLKMFGTRDEMLAAEYRTKTGDAPIKVSPARVSIRPEGKPHNLLRVPEMWLKKTKVSRERDEAGKERASRPRTEAASATHRSSSPTKSPAPTTESAYFVRFPICGGPLGKLEDQHYLRCKYSHEEKERFERLNRLLGRARPCVMFLLFPDLIYTQSSKQIEVEHEAKIRDSGHITRVTYTALNSTSSLTMSPALSCTNIVTRKRKRLQVTSVGGVVLVVTT
ncbi:hypothetical protein BJ878DRAFT_482131 [Calycina marina]|uniref:Uncharacterized protein n=1 Tax=Calycina marina TaxID=1763456 RepID=A0A9P8CCU5_9HELO|nr:hypothetical protein BJ878DRAFT_482131 [Calycina marina]